MANFGRRPTVNDRGALFEVNLFDIERDLYNKRLTVCIMDFIRPELKFDGLDALKTQIALDAASARAILANCRCRNNNGSAMTVDYKDTIFLPKQASL